MDPELLAEIKQDTKDQDSSRLLMSLSNEEFDKTAAPSETEITEAFLTGKRARDLAAAASHTTAVNPKLRFK